jgi:hypothetical protein
VQQHLRAIFTEWGRPQTLRVDNGAPWGSWSDLPTALALWVIGLDIQMHWNTPVRPQENGVIERSQGLAQTWGEPDKCQTVRQFQMRINREDRLQRAEFPSIGGKPRMTAYPALQHSGRHYSPAWEKRHWNWEQVLAHLSGYSVPRRVDNSGKIGLYHGKLYVGTVHQGRNVYVQFDPQRIEWIVTDDKGRQIRSTPAEGWTPTAVRRLRVPRSALRQKK